MESLKSIPYWVSFLLTISGALMTTFVQSVLPEAYQPYGFYIGLLLGLVGIIAILAHLAADKGFSFSRRINSTGRLIPVLELCRIAGIEPANRDTKSDNAVLSFAENLTQECVNGTISIEGREASDYNSLALAKTHHSLVPIPREHLAKHILHLWGADNSGTTTDYLKLAKPFYFDLHVNRKQAARWLKRWRKTNRQA